VSALPRLRQRHPGLRLVIAGDGPHRAELQAEAHRLDLHRAVSFAGFVGPDLPATFAASNAVVVPSIYEPFGMVALEAAAAGAPLAVASTGGLAEIVESGVTGVTFPANDPDALAEAVSTLLADEVSARRMARRARAMVERRYGWGSIAQRTADAYRQAQPAPPAGARSADAWPPVVVPEGNLLALDGALG